MTGFDPVAAGPDELRAEIGRLEAVADHSASFAAFQLERLCAAWDRAEAAEATVARVEALRAEWEGGMEPVHHCGYIADLDRALRGDA